MSKTEENNPSNQTVKLTELERRLQRKENQQAWYRFLFLSSLALIIIGFFFWFQSELLSEFFSSYKSNIKDNIKNVQLWGSFFILFSTVGFSYLFMAGFDPRKRKSNNNKEKDILNSNNTDYLEIVTLLKSIDKSIEKGKLESVLSEEERKEVIEGISSTVDEQLNESLLTKIENIYGTAIHNEKLGTKADELLTKTVERLKLELEKLQSKATINLSYGIGATIIAIFILIYVLINATPPKDEGLTITIFYFTSRLFLVFMVQGIAIFFLKLYKTTLDDIMYINNEVTNYEAKRDALSLSFRAGESKPTTEMLALLAKTERNFTLKKGETSVYTESSSNAEIPVNIGLIKDLLSKLPK